MTLSFVSNLLTDPDLAPGDHITLERADGRPVWRQRLKVIRKMPYGYYMEAVDEMEAIVPRQRREP